MKQAQETLEHLKVREKTVLLGDFNASPDSNEMRLLRKSGFRDAADLTGMAPFFTFPSFQPSRRLDYIWVTPDLKVSNFVVSPSTASDHLGLAVTVETQDHE